MKPSLMSFLECFFWNDARQSCKEAGLLHKGEALSVTDAFKNAMMTD